jgi:DNA-binding transcriptional ArsR family regulator
VREDLAGSSTQRARDRSSLDDVFGALSDPTRRAILERLSVVGGATVGELADPFDVSLPAIMRHVRVLEDAGLIESRKAGRERRCRIAQEPPRDALAWIVRYGRFWEHQLDSLAAFLERG